MSLTSFSNSEIKIEDNYLAQEDFEELQHLIAPQYMGDDEEPVFPWHYSIGIDYPGDQNFQFIHLFYDVHNNILYSEYFNDLSALIQAIKPFTLARIKGNLLTRTNEIIKNTSHTDLYGLADQPEKLKLWTTSIFYCNTNNGYTEFETGERCDSVANRLVTFPANMKHFGTSCTDENIRVVINLNYFK